MDRPLRVIQWATGRTGTQSMRAVIDHPDMEPAGLWGHSPDKPGKDAGALCDGEATGVVATNSLDEIVAPEADCVL